MFLGGVMNIRTFGAPDAPLGVACAGYRRKGFSLIELLVAISIVATLLTVGVPSYREYIERQRAVSLANQIVADIHMARSEALRREGEVALVRTGANWAEGWKLVADGSPIPDGSERIVFSPLGGLLTPSGGTEISICSRPDGTGKRWRVVLSGSGHVEARAPSGGSSTCG